jgi:hypothetical protein
MLHPETLEAYRRMTPSQRFKVMLEMMRENSSRIFHGSADQVDRRFELLHRQNEDRNQRMLKAIARTRS